MWHMCRNVVFHYAGARKGAVRSRTFDTPINTRMQSALEIVFSNVFCSSLYVHLHVWSILLMINRGSQVVMERIGCVGNPGDL